MPAPRARFAALALGLFALTAAGAAGPLPAGAYKKALDADVAALNKLLNNGKPEKGAMSTVKPLALMIAANAQYAGNAGMAAAAIKVAEAAAKSPKDWAGAAAAAKSLAAASGGAAPAGPVHTFAKFDLADVMAPFRPTKSGGLNIEKDIREAKKAGTADPAAAELLAARCATLAEFTAHFPNDKASGAKAAQWKKYCDAMLGASKAIAEAATGKKDPKAIGKLMSGLDASCVNCHNDFRD